MSATLTYCSGKQDIQQEAIAADTVHVRNRHFSSFLMVPVLLALCVPVHAATPNTYSVLSYGADASGAADSTTAFQTAANNAAASKGTLLVPPGNYKVSSPIEVGSSMQMDSSAVVKATTSMSAVIRVGSNATIIDGVFTGGKIDANSLASDGIIFRQFQHILVTSMVVANAQVNGFHFGDSTLSTSSYEAVGQGLYTRRDSGTSLLPGSTGVLIDSNATDNNIAQSIFVSSDIGMKVMTSGNFFTDIHVWSLPSVGWMTIGFDDQGTGNFWKGCEADTVQAYGLRARKYNTIIEGCRFYNNSTYGQDNTATGIYFDQSSPGASVSSTVFYGGDSSHRLAADMDGATTTVATNGNQALNVVSLADTTSSTGALAVSGSMTASNSVYANSFSSIAANATSSANTTTSLSLAANYYSSSGSTGYSWNIAPSQTAAGVPSITDLTVYTKGTLPSGVSPRFIFSATPASSSTPNPSMQQVFQGSYLNSSNAAAYDAWGVQNVLGSGTTPTSILTFSHWGSGGTSAVSVPTLVLHGDTMTYAPRLTWSSFGTCPTNTLNCQESNMWTPTKAIVIDQWTFSLMTPPSGCSWYPTVSLKQGSTVLGSIKLASGTTNYSYGTMSTAVSSANGALYLSITSAATGCTTYASGVASSIEYIMQ
jgi:hypothetical protein